ncbi:MAG: hypothetical protein D6820_04390 [Lentisphaerae bacterium]|nr:MAG: hypothetical protein D6820_04390 [Lentisphaerota bacterium]
MHQNVVNRNRSILIFNYLPFHNDFNPRLEFRVKAIRVLERRSGQSEDQEEDAFLVVSQLNELKVMKR